MHCPTSTLLFYINISALYQHSTGDIINALEQYFTEDITRYILLYINFIALCQQYTEDIIRFILPYVWVNGTSTSGGEHYFLHFPKKTWSQQWVGKLIDIIKLLISQSLNCIHCKERNKICCIEKKIYHCHYRNLYYYQIHSVLDQSIQLYLFNSPLSCTFNPRLVHSVVALTTHQLSSPFSCSFDNSPII